jgi:hypothetical protein
MEAWETPDGCPPFLENIELYTNIVYADNTAMINTTTTDRIIPIDLVIAYIDVISAMNPDVHGIPMREVLTKSKRILRPRYC